MELNTYLMSIISKLIIFSFFYSYGQINKPDSSPNFHPMHRSASVKRPLEVTRFEEDPSFQSSAYKAIKLEAEMSENQRLSPKLSCSDEKSESAWRPW